jgi:hypothetical protein
MTPSPAVPLNVTRAFWPLAVVVTVTAGPPSVAVAVTSPGTSKRVSVTVPVAVSTGSTMIVYVPVTGKVWASISVSPDPAPTGATRRVPSGLRMETLTVQQAVGVKATRRLTRRPAVPEKVRRPFW